MHGMIQQDSDTYDQSATPVHSVTWMQSKHEKPFLLVIKGKARHLRYARYV